MEEMALEREAAACLGESELRARVKRAQMILHVVVERQIQGAIVSTGGGNFDKFIERDLGDIHKYFLRIRGC